MPLDIRYKIENIDTYFRKDELSTLLFYIKDINYDLATKLYFLLEKEIAFRLENHLDIGNLDAFNDMSAHFDSGDIEESIQSIANQVIPSLQNERLNIWEKYGGFDNLKNEVNNGNDWSFNLNINYDYVPEYVDYYIDMLIEIKELLQKSLDLNTPIIVSYED
ncbi:hypothetical protein [Flavobacterium johnsoniae]|jgi:hypothetical protein|uniref:Uncharacterized protein n=1 Tax=Flavobacterium johnsoniae (strain ATCC 17061 / DSM 2064 / JCM 8514 / BCRC 14874 / CCUG 350202 / NBRC 14942 / NCIMB 11054 / UW101) TaxID=376686 RepID=A5FI72_FLAJ1|nr:hypothetical protein [Flavobacterium johnsoniae]ABQ05096.1 hypothetical protein Fjoh_2066 [Flavobacterium johnsoniae UW101]OXG00331.1 hypothetical protein B0A63_09350 [Flavobacterium johnsoniae UW101]WQG83103.1 hypothetical protein SR927_08275 [Flavobacterium johnsoniae UW101]SHL91457.1 hypothetical protein SAMN05444146_4944 [Flavobacterium johnsoniae]